MITIGYVQTKSRMSFKYTVIKIYTNKVEYSLFLESHIIYKMGQIMPLVSLSQKLVRNNVFSGWSNPVTFLKFIFQATL